MKILSSTEFKDAVYYPSRKEYARNHHFKFESLIQIVLFYRYIEEFEQNFAGCSYAN